MRDHRTDIFPSSQASIDAHQNPLTDEALEAAKNAHAILLGAIGGPKYGTGPIRPEQGKPRLPVYPLMTLLSDLTGSMNTMSPMLR